MESSPSGGWGEQFYRVLKDLKFSPTPVGGFPSPPPEDSPPNFCSRHQRFIPPSLNNNFHVITQ